MNGLLKNILISIIVSILIVEISCESQYNAEVDNEDVSNDIERTVLLRYYLDLLKELAAQKRNRYYEMVDDENAVSDSPQPKQRLASHRLKDLLEKRAMKNVAFGFGKKWITSNLNNQLLIQYENIFF